MTNQIAIALGLLILAALGYDHYSQDGAALLFLAKKGLALIEWLAFWR
ncbi:hypothetical protein M8756_08335 [Lutimaribacter sp. EGI FJ00015]|uniref:Uncharacterized protein n=1 Tax=Lutimaribacter degradans TaxID=2945989 RepID=A0ACC5ZWN5_9RHOB|nr:hypothetical protein [Lutimaribacter sp. EGI FJ00013]MCM2562161.1 hypothetical protein [Lutimaribacter sp. EGI FJ00013]MCO0613315.1 hypothetical protein [Lutimaribacter sp. EGI FJ00015]MCO0636290.1 hypothetical protein [Lutimaribacter sp. EGI FJ00014]